MIGHPRSHHSFFTMRIRTSAILLLLVSCLAFNGCFEIYYDIVQNPNGTFLIRQTVGFGAQFFQELAAFGSSDSTAPVSTKMIMDSMRHTFALHRDSLIQSGRMIGQNGITDFTVHDTTIDTMTFFSLEAAVVSADSLEGAFHRMSSASESMGPAASDPGSRPADSDDVRLKVTRTNARTTFTFYAPPKAAGFMNIGMPGLEESFKNLSMHYRVFSPSLEPPRDKQVKQIPGGEERTFGLHDLTQKGRHSHLEASFVIKNSVAGK
jgi:hypothetical protein